MLLISGTAKWDGDGHIVAEDFRAQTWQTFQNLTALLEAEGATWDKVVRTTCHLRDLKQDYGNFNEVRNRFYKEIGLGSRPASTGIEGRIHPQDLPQLFDELYRGRNAKDIEGNGLGLALVQRVVELHQGQIKVRSRLGEGTAVIMHLPLTGS